MRQGGTTIGSMDFDALRKAQQSGLQPGAQSPAKASRVGDSGFASAFEKATQSQEAPEPVWREHLERIEEASRRFGQQSTPDTLIGYKQAIREFLEEFLKKSHKRRRLSVFDPQAEHDLVLLVRTIDSRLEDLSGQFIRQEGAQLQLLSLLDEIRGMLLDLVA